MLLTAFRIRFPEFRNAPDDLVQACLDAAAQEVDPDTWGLKYDEGHGLCAANLLALSPFGQGARTNVQTGAPTTYQVHFDRMVSTLGKAHFGLL
jgi:hypothetical protein